MTDRLKNLGTDITIKEVRGAGHWLPLTHKESVLSEIMLIYVYFYLSYNIYYVAL